MFSAGGKVQSKSGTYTRGTLHVAIKQAKELPAMNARNLTDATVKCYLLPDRRSSSKRKTPIVTGSVNPVWEEEFTYEVTQEGLMEERVLEVTVWDSDKHSHDLIGALRLGPSPASTGRRGKPKKWMDSSSEEVLHWEEMLSQPGKWIERWHVLRPSNKYMKPSAGPHPELLRAELPIPELSSLLEDSSGGNPLPSGFVNSASSTSTDRVTDEGYSGSGTKPRVRSRLCFLCETMD